MDGNTIKPGDKKLINSLIIICKPELYGTQQVPNYSDEDRFLTLITI